MHPVLPRCRKRLKSMANFIKLFFIAFSDIDPLILIAPICLVLVVLVVAALCELEQTRVRLHHKSRARQLLPKSQAALREPSTDS